MNEKVVLAGIIQPRIIIHGGAGNIKPENLPPKSYDAYKTSILEVLTKAYTLLRAPDATALDVAVYAVSLLEDDPLFNCGKGAVFTRAGTNELEASVMVSNGYRKRGVGCMLLEHVKNPIKLAREMLVKGEKDDGGGAGQHSQLSGAEIEELAASWGLEMVDQKYFFTQRRWDEHLRGLEREKQQGCPITSSPAHVGYADPSWDGHEYLPQGTVGAVVLDRSGTLCVATSTGGLTNKLPGRIGDTPTLGAGFWAEQWTEDHNATKSGLSPLDMFSRGDLSSLLEPCLQSLPVWSQSAKLQSAAREAKITRAVAMSGTGNGDSFLRVDAARTAAAMARFSPSISLAEAVDAVAGPGGELQKSAGDRFGKTGEGDGGIIGIELVGSRAFVVQNHNCGGMFRAWVDDAGKHKFRVFRDEDE